MTAVIAYSNGSNVWIAGDGYCGDEMKKDICKNPKTYVINGQLAVGISGLIRQEMILKKVLKTYAPKKITSRWLLFDFPDILQETMKKCNALIERDGQQTAGDSGYIFGLMGKIYYLDTDFGIWETAKNIASIGSGREYCLGALSAMSKKTLNLDPEKCLIRALEIASEWSPWVTPPFTISKV
jgi:ATP-dependent protease HslVU (ClpYQ) peptidase subunit